MSLSGLQLADQKVGLGICKGGLDSKIKFKIQKDTYVPREKKMKGAGEKDKRKRNRTVKNT